MNKLTVVTFYTILLCAAKLQGQNAYQFIEPNVSISYNSNYFEPGNRYSNSFYETEEYDFTYRGDTAKRMTIHVKPGYPTGIPDKQAQDSSIINGLEAVGKLLSDSISVLDIDKKVRDINNFSCAGITSYDNVNKEYTTMIVCYHYSGNDNTEIYFVSHGNDIENEYAVVNSFLKGFTSYSKQQIEKEEQLIKSGYTVLVTPVQTAGNNFDPMPKTYAGTVTTKQPLQHTIAEVRLRGSAGEQIFTPGENGKVYITANDKDRGKILKKGELVLLNSFGKKVKIPFSFSYINKGRL